MKHYPRSKTTLLLLAGPLALLAVCSALSGCGSNSSAEAPTKREFIAHADHLCRHAEKTLVLAAVAYEKTHPHVEEVDLVPAVAVPAFENEIQQIRALGMPIDGQAEVEAFVNAFENGIVSVTKNPHDIFVAETNPFNKAKHIAADYGLKLCSAYP